MVKPECWTYFTLDHIFEIYILQEVNNLKHVVEVRESKLVELSKENVDLQETASILQRLVHCKQYMIVRYIP